MSDRNVIGWITATGDPPVPGANAHTYEGTFLSSAEHREYIRRLEIKPIPFVLNHGSSGSVGPSYIPSEEEIIGEARYGMSTFDNRLLIVGALFDHPDSRKILEEINQGHWYGLSPFCANALRMRAHQPQSIFNLDTTHYGICQDPEFSTLRHEIETTEDWNLARNNSTFIHEITLTERTMVEKVRLFHLKDGVYFTRRFSMVLGLIEEEYQQFMKMFYDQMAHIAIAHEHKYGLPMSPDIYDSKTQHHIEQAISRMKGLGENQGVPPGNVAPPIAQTFTEENLDVEMKDAVDEDTLVANSGIVDEIPDAGDDEPRPVSEGSEVKGKNSDLPYYIYSSPKR
jgi:hypothetical protein